MATRLQMRTRARRKADQNDADFPTDTDYNDYLDEAGKETFADLVMSGWPVDTVTDTLVTNASQRVYPFGVGNIVFSTTMVYTNIGGEFAELKRVNPGHMAQLRSGAITGLFARFYEVRTGSAGSVIEFFPPTAGTYFIDYIVDFPGFTNDASTWLGPPRSDELIVLQAAAKGCRKESRHGDADRIMADYARLLDKVQRLSSWYDMRNPAQMRDAVPFIDPNSFRNVDFFAGPGGMF